jgi:hypothetical protein
VRYLRADNASPQRVVVDADKTLLGTFVRAVQQLATDGAALISTSCGFLAEHQSLLAQAVSVPVVSSSLLQCAELPRPGIVTFDAHALSPEVLQGAGVPPGAGSGARLRTAPAHSG